MPSSTPEILTPVMKEIIKTQPQTMLDIGIGFGKYGFLAREYLESWNDRTFPKDWKLKIHGIEIFEPYVKELPWQKTVYDIIYTGDAFSLIQTVGYYDLITAGDVVEHLEKEKGIFLIKECLKRINKCAIFSIPMGNWMNNVVIAGNEAENHRAIWEKEDLLKIGKEFPKLNLELKDWNVGSRMGCLAIWRK